MANSITNALKPIECDKEENLHILVWNILTYFVFFLLLLLLAVCCIYSFFPFYFFQSFNRRRSTNLEILINQCGPSHLFVGIPRYTIVWIVNIEHQIGKIIIASSLLDVCFVIKCTQSFVPSQSILHSAIHMKILKFLIESQTMSTFSHLSRILSFVHIELVFTGVHVYTVRKE